jgi:glycosyltransferase involved in cell wall biosynthesis
VSAAGPQRIGFELNPHIIGGTENFLRRLFAHLDPRRFVPVALGSAPGRWQDFLDGVAEMHVVPYRTAASLPADVAGALRRMRLDLVQSSHFSPVVACAAAQAQIPHVWRFGGHVDAIERHWSEREKAHLLTIAQLTSRRVICGSRYLRTQFDRVGGGDIDVIYNGIDLVEVPLSDPGAAQSDLSVAMVAHFVPQKRHAVFVRAMAIVAAQVPGARFFIFGGSYGTPELLAYEQSLRALARELHLDGRLEFRELRADRFATLRNATIVALPGVHEGASNAILESMALGKPVVAARSGSNPELIADGITGMLVPAENPEVLATAIIELLRDPARRAAMGTAARARVERDFDIRMCARRYEDLYAGILGASLGTEEG